MKVNSVLDLIGNTPVIEIDKKITGLKNINLFVKCELFNPFGSVKDRAGYSMLKNEIQDIKQEGKIVIESSSGNTGKAFSVICAMNGVQFNVLTNRIRIPEVKDILKVLGVNIMEVPSEAHCFDPENPYDPTVTIKKMVADEPEKYFHPSQYFNLKNPQIHFETTGPEIEKDIGKIDYFLGTLGTTGSTRGTIKYLLTKNKDMKKIGIVADKGDYIPGIRNIDEMKDVGIFEQDLYDEILTVNSTDAISGMLTLNRKIGLLAGPTSGSAYFGSLEYLKKIDATLTEQKNAVFIACDRMEWYMSYIKKRRPDLFDGEIKKENIRHVDEKDLSFARIIDVENISDFIEKQKPTIIDLRGNMAFNNGHIKNSINITDSFFENIVDNGIPFSKTATILFVCPVGDKSKQYSAFLNKKGFNCYSLSGGMTAYKDAKLSVERTMKKIEL